MKRSKFIKDYLSALKNSVRPLILVGGGVRSSGAVGLFELFVLKRKIPVVTSLMGIDVLPSVHPLKVGFIGIYGNRWANYALGNCDLLLVLGSRLDSRQTGNRELFKQGKTIYHVDIDKAELNNNITGCVTLEDNIWDFLRDMVDKRGDYTNEGWLEEIRNERVTFPDTGEINDCKGINPNVFIHQLSKASTPARVFTTDVGNNQMWCAQSIEIDYGQEFLTSAGMGSMGYSLPAAIGASIALDNCPVVSISGDGGFQMNIQELQTVTRNNLPIKMVVLNNRSLGMIRHFQDAYFGSRYQSSVWDYSAPSFVAVANAYGIKSFLIDKEIDIDKGISKLWKDHHSPFLLEVMINSATKVSPKVMFGNPLTKMD